MNLCTYFDERYLPRALTLYDSLVEFSESFHLYALCLDEASFEYFRENPLPTVTPISVAMLEQGTPNLAACKQGRSVVEYYWTCGPAFMLYLLSTYPSIDQISYIDADTMFFSSPDPLIEEIAGHSVSIVAHRFSPAHRFREKFGKYNVGWLTFRRDEQGLRALHWWSERCIEWCFDRVEANRFGDQKYLDQFPELFPGVHVIQHKGVNVGPWNIGNHTVSEEGDRIYIDDQPLVFFHFHGFKQVKRWLYDANLGLWGRRPPTIVRRKIYGKYIHALEPHNKDRIRSLRILDYSLPGPVRLAKRIRRILFGIFRFSYIVVLRGRPL